MNRGGWSGLISLRKIRKATLFDGLKVTNQVVAHLEIFSRSVLRQVAADAGSLTMIKRLVSSANRRILETTSVFISLIYTKNSKGRKIEP